MECCYINEIKRKTHRSSLTDRGVQGIGKLSWFTLLVYIQTRANLFVFLYGLKKAKESICMGL